MNDEVISYSAEEKQKAGLPSFIGLVDSALKEAKTMLEGDEQVYSPWNSPRTSWRRGMPWCRPSTSKSTRPLRMQWM